MPRWSLGLVVLPGPVPRPQPSFEPLHCRSRIGYPVDPFGRLAWPRGPVVPSGPVPRPQPGLGCGSQGPDSVARGTRSVCPDGLAVPWSCGRVWPRGSSPAWLRSWVPGSGIGCPGDPFGVPGWSRGPVVPWSRLTPVWPPSGPQPRPQPGLDHGSLDPESVARRGSRLSPVWLPSVSRLAPAWPRSLVPSPA